jgi:aminopeptidase
MNKEKLRKYAELAVKMGVNIQKGQPLAISSPIETAQFTRFLVEEAYKAGARKVSVDWHDESISKMHYEFMDLEDLKKVPKWSIDKAETAMEENTARISISASNPELLKDIDPVKIKESGKARSQALVNVQAQLMANKVQWCVLSIPTINWAKKVFPDVSDEEAVTKLWDAIFSAVRIKDDNDPIEEWKQHNKTLAEKVKTLNDLNLSYLHFTSSNGTDFKVGLVKNHIWAGGSEYNQSNVEFNPNMPTEEVFTMPDANFAEGKVVASKPLNYNGQLINNFELIFKDGKVVDFNAEQGKETLRSLIELDEGSCRLGEVALVPYESPISLSGILFFNTLFDENAACHLALGKAYPMNIKDGTNLSLDELKARGANHSLTHVDFMIGTKDLDIVGYDQEGKSIQIFKNGNWAI